MTSLPGAIVVVVFALGLIIGSFLNVVAWRVPRGESIVHPPSACPHCGTPIKPHDNVPVLSWLVLRGRCRSCNGPISPRYPLVELGTGSAFAAVTFAGFLNIYSLALVPLLLYFAAISIVLALIDIDTHRLPNPIVLPSYLVVFALLALASALTGNWWALIWALCGGAILFATYFVMVLIYPRGMGFGDVKLAGVIGLVLGWLGWGTLAVGGFAAFLLGGLFGILLLLTRKAGRKSAIPFGPWMLVGAWVGVFAGEALSRAYLSLVGLA
jgi:leader peptidase (prepilin peptidase)/N-methyltransferase